MTSVELVVKRKGYRIKGIGRTKPMSEPIQVPQAENMDEVLNLFDGTPDEKEKTLVAAANRLAVRQAKSKKIEEIGGGVDATSPIATIRTMVKMYAALQPNKTAEEIGQLVLGLPGVEDQLKAAGIEFEADSDSDDADEDDADSDDDDED